MLFDKHRICRPVYTRVGFFVVFVIIAGIFFWKNIVPVFVASATWAFDTASDYFYNTGLVSVSGGVASLVSQGGGTVTVNHNDNSSGEFGGGTSTSIQWVNASSSLQISSGVSGTFTSPVIDASSTVSWQTLAWTPYAPHGKEVVTGTAETEYATDNFTNISTLVAYWRFNEASWNGTPDEVIDSSGSGNNGSRRGGADTSGSVALFNRSASLPLTASSYVYVTSSNFRSADEAGTIAMWVYPTSSGGGSETFRHIFTSTDESAGTASTNRVVFGLADISNVGLFYHADGSTFDALYGETVMATNQWHHMVFTSDGTVGGYRMYIDGIQQALSTTFTDSGGNANSGDWFADANGSGATGRDNVAIGGVINASPSLFFEGYVDEVAVFSEPLSLATVQSLYRRGAQRLRFQVRSCDDNACSGETFVGPDGTSSSYYTESTTTTVGLPSKTLTGLSSNRYFQYRAFFDTTSTLPSSALLSVTTTASGGASYSTSSPTIVNNTGFSFNNISAFTHTLGVGNQGTVEYQVAVGNTSTWYYWNGSSWVTASAGYPTHTNTVSEVNSNILQLDSDVGTGAFYFRAFLVSDGTQQVELSDVTIVTTSTIAFASSTGSASENSGTSTIIIQLDGVSSSTVTVNYAITGGTATTSDYTFTTGTASIVSGGTTTSISLGLVDDSVAEASETIIITLSSAVGGLLGSTSTFTFTITDNESAGVTVGSTSMSVTEGGTTSSYTLVLGSQPSTTVSIAVTSTSGQITLSTTTIIFTTSTWNVPQTVAVTAVDDSSVEGSHSTTIAHTVTSADTMYDAISVSNVTVSITDNDTSQASSNSSSSSSSSSGSGVSSFSTPPPTVSQQTSTGEGSTSSNQSTIGNTVEASSEKAQLRFAVQGAVRMALSNNKEFRGSVQQPYTDNINWDICEGLTLCETGNHTIYILFYNSQGVPSKVVTQEVVYHDHTKSQHTDIPPLSKQVTLYKTDDDPRVFEVIGGEKRWITSEKMFTDLGYKWSDIQVVTRSVLQHIPDSSNSLQSVKQEAEKPVFDSLLRFGMNGETILRLQVLLRELGFFPNTVEANGNFGSATRSALQAFQRANNISPVGYAGPQTRALLNSLNRSR